MIYYTQCQSRPDTKKRSISMSLQNFVVNSTNLVPTLNNGSFTSNGSWVHYGKRAMISDPLLMILLLSDPTKAADYIQLYKNGKSLRNVIFNMYHINKPQHKFPAFLTQHRGIEYLSANGSTQYAATPLAAFPLRLA